MPNPSRKRIPSTKKKKHNSSIEWRIIKYLFFFFCSIGIIIFAYEYGNGVLYYLGFKSNKNSSLVSEEERQIADIHIYEVLNSHKDFMVGFDVSEYQGKIDWTKINTIEDTFALSFAFVRATAGSDKLDKRFHENWSALKRKGIVRGAYHYYRPNENSKAQAQNFIKHVRLEKGDFPPVLDIEKLPKTQSLDSLKVGLKRWLNIVTLHYKMKPIIYSGESYYNDFLRKEFSDYTFWIANYNFWKKSPDAHWLIWQFSEKGNVDGINGPVDLNLFNGDFIKMIETTKN